MSRLLMKRISAANFRPFGRLIHYPGLEHKGRQRNLWRIVLAEPGARGWRIAYLVLRDKRIRRMESHPESFESFEPVWGKSLLFVAKKKDIRAIKCFRLDRPVILKKGVWHGVVTVTPETQIKITENAQVKCLFWPLGFHLPQKEGK